MPRLDPWFGRIPAIHVVASGIQLGYFVWFQTRPGVLGLTLNAADVATVLYSFVTLNVVVALAALLAQGRRRAYLILVTTTTVLCALAFGYHLNTKTSPDWSIIIDNSAEGFSLDSLGIVASYLGVKSLLIAAGVVAFLILAERWGRRISQGMPRTALRLKLAAVGTLYGAMLVAPVTTYDEFTGFLRSIYQHYAQSALRGDYVEGTWPAVNAELDLSVDAPRSFPAPPGQPNVLLLFIESFNASFVEADTPDGRPYTPNFNAMIPQGVYPERFHGNSIQTCKGAFATLFSMIPSISGKVFRDYPDRRFRGLPAILRDHGYRTIFWQAHPDLSFDNTGSFLAANGFDDVHAASEFLDPGEEQYVWGWGLQDDVFYRKFFEHLDREHAAHPDRPLFGTAMTIESHMMFDQVPEGLRGLYPSPETHRENYANAIHLADRHLPLFFDAIKTRPYLANTIVVVLGDHSFPTGEHGLVYAGTGYYEEFFRTPMLLRWDGVLPPRRLREGNYSQVDVAPTVLHLLGITGERNHFRGHSLLDPGRIPEVALLVQPYEGRYLGAVRYPLKYVWHERTDRARLFDLAQDPQETVNIIDRVPESVRARFRDDIKAIYLNQTLILRDRVWPGP